MSELDNIRKRRDNNYYSDMEIWDLADDLLRIATDQEAELTQLRTEVRSVGSTMEHAIDKAGTLEDELTQLRTERDRMREALEAMVEMVEMNGFCKAYAMDVARAALTQRKGGEE